MAPPFLDRGAPPPSCTTAPRLQPPPALLRLPSAQTDAASSSRPWLPPPSPVRVGLHPSCPSALLQARWPACRPTFLVPVAGYRPSRTIFSGRELAAALKVSGFRELLFTNAPWILHREKAVRSAEVKARMIAFFYYKSARPPCLSEPDGQVQEMVPMMS